MLIAFLLVTYPFWHSQTHEHSNDDSNGSENVNTAIDLLSKKEKFARFLYISLLLLNDCNVKMRNFTYYGGCE